MDRSGIDAVIKTDFDRQRLCNERTERAGCGEGSEDLSATCKDAPTVSIRTKQVHR